MKLYGQKDVDKKALKGARIAILGYGSQGRAHALNLKDSGFDVVVGVRKNGASWKKAKKDGLAVADPVDAAAGADLIAMLVPDMAQKAVYETVEKSLKKGATLLFAHGDIEAAVAEIQGMRTALTSVAEYSDTGTLECLLVDVFLRIKLHRPSPKWPAAR